MKISYKHPKMHKISKWLSILIIVVATMLVGYLAYILLNKGEQEINLKAVNSVIEKRKTDKLDLQKRSDELDNPTPESKIVINSIEEKNSWLSFHAQSTISLTADDYLMASSKSSKRRHYPNCAEMQMLLKNTKVEQLREGVCKITASTKDASFDLYYGYNNTRKGIANKTDPCHEVSRLSAYDKANDIIVEYQFFDQSQRIYDSPTIFSNLCIQN